MLEIHNIWYSNVFMNTNLTILYSIYMGKYRVVVVYKASQQKQWFRWCASHTEPVSRDLGTYILLCIWAKKLGYFSGVALPKSSPQRLEKFTYFFSIITLESTKVKMDKRIDVDFHFSRLRPSKKGYIHENGSGKSPRRRKVCFYLGNP